MRLYTRTGDRGETGLIGGKRVAKSDPRVACYGDVDELNATIGLAAAACDFGEWLSRLRTIQSDLFILGTQLATAPGREPEHQIDQPRIDKLETWLDELAAMTPPLVNFVLPGGCELASRFHLARTVCRRAERAVVDLAAVEPVQPLAVVYLNRLSDLLFAFALASNVKAGVANIDWIAPKPG